MRYAKFVAPIMMFLMATPAAHAAWFRKDSKTTSKAKAEVKQVVQKQAQAAVQQVEKKMPVVAVKPQSQKQAASTNAAASANPGFVDMDLRSGTPRIVDKDSGDEAQVSRLEAEEFEKKKKEIEELMASVNSAKGVNSIPSSPAAVQELNAIPHKETYAPAKGGSGLTVELGALPKSTLTGTAAGSVAQKPSIPAETVKR